MFNCSHINILDSVLKVGVCAGATESCGSFDVEDIVIKRNIQLSIYMSQLTVWSFNFLVPVFQR